MATEQIRLLPLIVGITLISGIGDSQGFVHAARMWQNGRLVWLEFAKSAAGFGVGIGTYWLAVKHLKEFGVLSPEIQTLIWSGVTIEKSVLMQIRIATGTGEGPTPLAAFDAALINAGVANYNLIVLSSVIPARCVIRRAKHIAIPDEYGYRLYLVMARHEEQQPGKSAWAGLGWTQEERTGCGLFVEMHGSDRARVESDINATLESMIASRPLSYGAIESEIVGIECRDKPVCALSVAVYQSQGWNQL